MSFAAMLSVSATHLAAVEHRIKPEPQLVQRLARLFLRPHYNYIDVVRRFRTLRPDPRDRRLRGMFRELRDPQTADDERSRLLADLIGDNTDLASRALNSLSKDGSIGSCLNVAGRRRPLC